LHLLFYLFKLQYITSIEITLQKYKYFGEYK